MQPLPVQHHAPAPPPPPALPPLGSEIAEESGSNRSKVFSRPKEYDPELAMKAHQEHIRRQELIGAAEHFAQTQRKSLKHDLGFSDDSSDDDEHKVTESVQKQITSNGREKHYMNTRYRQQCESCQALCYGQFCAYCEKDPNEDPENGIGLEDDQVVLKEEYELLQQRYLTTLKDVHDMGERERECLASLAGIKRVSKLQIKMIRDSLLTKMDEQCDLLEDAAQLLKNASSGVAINAETIEKYGNSCDEHREEIERLRTSNATDALSEETVNNNNGSLSAVKEVWIKENEVLRASLADLLAGKVPLKTPKLVDDQAGTGQKQTMPTGEGPKHEFQNTSEAEHNPYRLKLAKAVKVAKFAKAKLVESQKENEVLKNLLNEANAALQAKNVRSESVDGGDVSELLDDSSNLKLSTKVRAKFKRLKSKLIESESERKKAIALVREMAAQLKAVQTNGQQEDAAKSLEDQDQSRQEANELNVRKEMHHQEEIAQMEFKVSKLQNQVVALQKQLKQAKESTQVSEAHAQQLDTLKKQIVGAKTEISTQEKIIHLSRQAYKKQNNSIAKLKAQIITEKQMAKALKLEVQNLISGMKDENVRAWRSVIQRIRTESVALEGIVAKYDREVKARKRLFNLVQELRGNIRVFCRVRPVSPGEVGEGTDSRVITKFPDDDSISLVNSKGREKKWDFDKVLHPNLSNEAIFEEVKDHCVSILDGYNVCIFAYGQTGSGKTYTMEGPAHDRGINHRALSKLFQDMKQKSEVDQEWTFSVQVSFLEIYNEQIRDLLAKQGSVERKMEVKQGPHGMYVPKLTMMDVENQEQVESLMSLGHKNRATAFTNMNEHSSRSHSMFSTYIVAKNRITGQVNRGKMHLIDLAGSERLNKSGATGMRMTEAQNINKSLSALGDVIQARANKAGHVPYRNSTLTYLLQDSLSQDSKTLMVVQVSPVSKNAEESFCSLNFAARVRKVELGVAKRNTFT